MVRTMAGSMMAFVMMIVKIMLVIFMDVMQVLPTMIVVRVMIRVMTMVRLMRIMIRMDRHRIHAGQMAPGYIIEETPHVMRMVAAGFVAVVVPDEAGFKRYEDRMGWVVRMGVQMFLIIFFVQRYPDPMIRSHKDG